MRGKIKKILFIKLTLYLSLSCLVKTGFENRSFLILPRIQHKVVLLVLRTEAVGKNTLADSYINFHKCVIVAF